MVERAKLVLRKVPQFVPKARVVSPDAPLRGRDGRPGRKRGEQAQTTSTLKEAILVAARSIGEDGKGLNGLIGYLKRIARNNEKEFISLLRAVLPLNVQQISDVSVTHTYRTEAEVREELRLRGVVIENLLEDDDD